MRSCYFILLLIHHFGIVFSQQLPIQNYAAECGALVGGANSLYRDSIGWMWMTTTYDVIRYDGDQFRIIPLAKGTKMDFCYEILDIGGKLCVLATPNILTIQNDSLVEFKAHGEIPNITTQLSIGNNCFVLANGGLFEWKEGSFEKRIDLDSNTFNQGETMVNLDDHTLLTYSWKKELLVLDLQKNIYKTIDLPVTALKNWRGRVYALVVGKGIYTIRLENIQVTYDLVVPLPENKAEYLEIDARNNFWVGVQDQYLIRAEPNGHQTKYTELEGLPSLWFKCMISDRDGNVWIGSNNGLSKIFSTGTERFTKDQGLYSNHIPTLYYQKEKDRLFIITTSGVNLMVNQMLVALSENGKPFECQHLLGKNDILYFVKEHSLFKASLDSKIFKVTAVQKLADFEGDALNIAEDRQSNLYIATTKGLFSWTGKKSIKLLDNQDHYHTLLIDRSNFLWAGPFATTVERYRIDYEAGVPKLISSDPFQGWKEGADLVKQIRAIVADEIGNIYVGTRFNGLFRFHIEQGNINEYRHWSDEDQLKSNSIWGLAIDTFQNCWIASAKGVDCLANKFEGDAYIFQAASIVVTGDNQIWVGTHPGLVHLDLESNASVPFHTYITELIVNDKKWKLDSIFTKPIRLPYDQNNISISYSSNTFSHENEISYTFSLTQHGQENWSPKSSEHHIHFSSLKPGLYEFKVRSQKPSGEWNTDSGVLQFEILRPFWQTKGFILLVIAAILGVIYAIHRFRIRQLLRLQEVRNAISRDLHDDIGASLSNINILNALAQRHLDDQTVVQQYLNKAGDDIQQISESLSDLVWNINPAHDHIDHLISHMKRYALDMLEGKNIEPELHFPSTELKLSLPMALRRDLYFIFKEAIHNLVKYSEATKATIQFDADDHQYQLDIRDNGKGFDSKVVSMGNGLKNMQQRAVRMKAVLHMKSEPGMGTSISLTGKF